MILFLIEVEQAGGPAAEVQKVVNFWTFSFSIRKELPYLSKPERVTHFYIHRGRDSTHIPRKIPRTNFFYAVRISRLYRKSKNSDRLEKAQLQQCT
jgi:hypothetical protein